MLKVVAEETARTEWVSSLDEICREGARRLLAAALKAERDAYIEALADEVDAYGVGWWSVTGTPGRGRRRRAQVVSRFERPRVDDGRVDTETGEGMRFRSSVVPAWCRRSPKVTEVLPLLYLHGMASGGLRASVGGILRIGGGPVGVGDHPAHDAAARRARRVHETVPSPAATSCTYGSTACTSTSVSPKTVSVPW
jgi:hypothetical protein